MNGATILTKFIADTKDLDNKTDSASSKLKSFAAGAGVAIGAAATAVASASAAIAKSFWNSANSVAEYGDEIDKTSQKIGFSTEAYQKWDYAMNIAGTSMQNCTIGLKTMTNKIDDALSGGKGATETFERLGISIDDLKGKTREEIFDMTTRSLQNMEDGLEKAAIANDLFGRSGQDLMPLFNSTNEELDKLMTQADEYGMVMSQDAVNASAEFQDSMTKLDKTIGGVKNRLIGAFLPGLKQVIDGFSDLVAGSEDAGDAIMAGVKNIAETIKSSIPKIVGIIQTILPILTTVLSDIILTIAQVLMENLPTIIQCGIDVLLALIFGIIQMIPQLIPTIVECLLIIVQALIDNIDLIIQGGIDLIFGLIDGLIEAIPILIEAMPQIIAAIVTGLIRNFPKILEAGKNLIGKLAEGLLSALGSIVNVGKDIVKGLWNGIKGLKDWVIEKIKGLGKSILKSLKNILGISSPSKEFAVIGKFSVLGYTEALDDMSKDVEKQVGETFGISPQLANSSSLSYSPNVQVVNNISMKQDPLGQMVNDIKTFSGGSKNDYNYGMGA